MVGVAQLKASWLAEVGPNWETAHWCARGIWAAAFGQKRPLRMTS